jgi:GGDEF domain-containing protein
MPSFVQFTPAESDAPRAGESTLGGLRSLALFALPVALLVAAQFAAPLAARLPPSLAGLRAWGPAMALAIALALALAFRRGRAVFAAVALAVAYAGYRLYLTHGLSSDAAHIVFAAICLFVPLNLLALSVLRERGVLTLYGVRRMGSIALQASLTAWVVVAQQTALVEWARWRLLDTAALSGALMPQLALLLLAAGVVAGVAGAVRRGSAIDAGFAVALVCFALACESVRVPYHSGVYLAAAAAALAVAVVHEAFRLAFRDELTGLPSRRALEERLLSLPAEFTVAMLDVDHFKRFNDRHGHELGDQVLRMVAAKLQRVGGGGRAYRYGGEEFAVLFPGRKLHQAWPHLEALRKAIAGHAVVVRTQPRDDAVPAYFPREAARRPQSDAAPTAGAPGALDRPMTPDRVTAQSAVVTVSIGVAQRKPQHASARDVLQAADKALYRAKHGGRNRVSR